MEETIKLVNLTELLKQYNEMEDVLDSIIDIFFESSAELLKNIELALDTQELEKLKIAAHTLKGALANFKSEKLVSIARALEENAQASSIEDSRKTYEELVQYSQQLEVELKIIQKKYLPK